jgi:nicotinamidase-related amidase
MSKIRDIIQINSGYTSYVEMAEYYSLEKNRVRMERYQPITAHRLAFEKIAGSLNPKDRRFYFLSGSYGTGKSHLLLMLANYFASSSDLPEMSAFFQNYETAQKQTLLKPGEILKERTASSLKAARKSGRFLVAICRFDLNLEFEGAILRAVEEAIQKEEPGFELASHYQEALRRIEDWEKQKNDKRFFSDLGNALSKQYSGWTINDLKDGLKERDEEALKVFKTCFAVVTDTDFTFKKDNLQDIVKDILTNPTFRTKFKGLVILYDELGYALDDGLVNLSRLHNFAQFCANSGMEHLPLIFIGTGHKAFRNHGQVGDAVHYSTLEARVTEIPLQTQGMEDIIAAIVQPKKEEDAWVKQVVPQAGTFTFLSGECKRLGLFNWLPAPRVKNNIIENIYPMHPLAIYALLRLALEAGSDNRSVFKFFSPEFETGEEGWKNVQEYSYPWFIEHNDILRDNRLVLYTADMLVDYFKDGLSIDNRKLVDRIKTAVVNYDATLRELNTYIARQEEGKLFEETDDLMLRLLKVILIHEMISTEELRITNTMENIQFALHAVLDSEKARVTSRLQTLCKAGILYNNQGIYELMRGDRKDIHRLIEQYKANPDNRPVNILEQFLSLNPLKSDEIHLEAKDYNSTYNEDKRLRVVFATPSMLDVTYTVNGKETSFFAWMESQRNEEGYGRNGYEGTALYVFCENDQDIEQAKKTIVKNDQRRVVIAIPRKPIPVFDPVFTLKAIEHIQKAKEAESFGPYEYIQINESRKTANGLLADAKGAYFNNMSVEWFGIGGANIPVNETKKHDVSSKLMELLYADKRNTFSHTEFNRSHVKIDGQVRSILQDAGKILLELSQTIQINWTWPDNRGGTRYLRKCFVDNQVLRLLNTEGDIRYYEAEQNLDKLKSQLPAYVKLLEDLASLQGKGAMLCWPFLQRFYENYGQGEIAMILMVLMARRFYGDSLRFKREKDALTDLPFTDMDQVINLITGQEKTAVILFEPVSQEDKAYFTKVFQIFSVNPVPAGKTYSLGDAFQAVTKWWQALPIIARSENFYQDKDKPFVTALNQTKTKDPFNFIKRDLLELLDIIPGEKITAKKLAQIDSRLSSFKETAQGILEAVQNDILKQVAEIYSSPGVLDVDIQEGIKTWLKDDLTSIQKDPLSPFHNNDSKPLILKLDKLVNIRDTLFNALPDAYGLNAVQNWSSDLVSDYINKIKKGKDHIEKNAPKIGQLNIKYENAEGQKGEYVNYKGELIINAVSEDPKDCIYYTDDGTDPAQKSSERQILKPGQALTVKGNRTIKMVVVNDKGNYGKVTTIHAIDELQKYKIKRARQVVIGDEMINFIFPTDEMSVKITVRSLFEELTSAKSVDIAKLEEITSKILRDMEYD